jgi:Tol biopolymer transport system component
VAPASAAPSLHRFFAPQGTVLGPKPLFGGPAVSPDGSGIVFAAVRGGESRLYLQLRTATESQPLPGTEDGCNPFWSPDNRRIGFFARGKLKITSISGGVAQEVCDVSTAFDNQGKGGTWNRDDVIVFATARLDALKKVSLRSGVPEPATVLANDESMHRWPFFLPDGQHFLYLSLQRGRTSSTWLGSLNPDEKKTLVLPNHNSSVIYAAGALLYVKGETLMAQPFDPAGHKIRGEAVRLAAIAPAPVTNSALFSASETGRLVYYGNDVTRVVLRDRSGREAWSSGDGRYVSIRLSPDGHRVAYELMFFADRFADSEKLWLLDLKTGQQTPYKGAASMVPRSTLFSSDGNQLIFSSGGNIYRTSLAEDKPEPLIQNKSIGFYPNDISREGFLLLQGNVRNNSDPARLWYARVTPQLALAQEPQPYTETFGQEARFSPDGRWVAYTSGDSGHQQIWIREFPSGRHKTLVSEQGGRFPAWGMAGREIVYLSDNYSLTAVPLQLGANSVLRPSGRATELFTVPAGLPGGEEGRSPWWDMTADGKTFYILEVRPTPIYVLDNWTTS